MNEPESGIDTTLNLKPGPLVFSLTAAVVVAGRYISGSCYYNQVRGLQNGNFQFHTIILFSYFKHAHCGLYGIIIKE